MEWSDVIITSLRALWAEGHSTAEIGRRLGVSKNAIVGKASRLDLPARPSPIKRSGEPKAPPSLPRPVGQKPTLPSLAAPAEGPARTEPVPAMSVLAAPVRTQASQPRFLTAPARKVIAPMPIRAPRACCWPIGTPGTKSFRFCEGPSDDGKVYCAEHCKLAYVGSPQKRRDLSDGPLAQLR